MLKSDIVKVLASSRIHVYRRRTWKLRLLGFLGFSVYLTMLNITDELLVNFM